MNTILPEEIAKFEAMAEEWWNPQGKFRPLHKMNPCRLKFITEEISWHFHKDLMSDRPFEGLRILDIGCGGGLLSEPMARLGAQIMGADAGYANIEVAKIHAASEELDIDYRHQTAESLVDEGEKFDVVLAMEIIEHVANPEEFVKSLQALLKPDGLLIISTLNRNAKSYLFAILGAEYVLRWLPKGTHEWEKFLTPDEVEAMMNKSKLKRKNLQGMVFHPISQSWSLSPRDFSVNYVISATQAG